MMKPAVARIVALLLLGAALVPGGKDAESGWIAARLLLEGRLAEASPVVVDDHTLAVTPAWSVEAQAAGGPDVVPPWVSAPMAALWYLPLAPLPWPLASFVYRLILGGIAFRSLRALDLSIVAGIVAVGLAVYAVWLGQMSVLLLPLSLGLATADEDVAWWALPLYVAKLWPVVLLGAGKWNRTTVAVLALAVVGTVACATSAAMDTFLAASAGLVRHPVLGGVHIPLLVRAVLAFLAGVRLVRSEVTIDRTRAAVVLGLVLSPLCWPHYLLAFVPLVLPDGAWFAAAVGIALFGLGAPLLGSLVLAGVIASALVRP